MLLFLHLFLCLLTDRRWPNVLNVVYCCLSYKLITLFVAHARLTLNLVSGDASFLFTEAYWCTLEAINSTNIVDVASVAENVQNLASGFSKQASVYRLNQPSLHANLLKANTSVTQQRNVMKAKLKTETLHVESDLWMFPAEGVTAKRVCYLFRFSLQC
jgi:hypothetical protein